MNIDFSIYSRTNLVVPGHTQKSLSDYLLKGYGPGGFVESMLAYDYGRAMYAADEANKAMFWAVAMWIRQQAPYGSHGSYDIVKDWIKDTHGLRSKFHKQMMWDSMKDDNPVDIG